MITVREADLTDPRDADALVAVIDAYAREEQGLGAPLPESTRATLAAGVHEHPAAFALLAEEDGQVVGAAVCLRGFSTFAARPTVNVHDLAVLPDARGRGVGGHLLDAVEAWAARHGCCKVTLEVNETNRARRLYERRGFGPWEPATLFVAKPVEE